MNATLIYLNAFRVHVGFSLNLIIHCDMSTQKERNGIIAHLVQYSDAPTEITIVRLHPDFIPSRHMTIMSHCRCAILDSQYRRE